MRGLRVCAWFVFGAAVAFAQVAKPQFDVASVKVVVPNGRGGGGLTSGGPGTSDPGHYVDPIDTMVGLLMRAYGVDNAQIIGPASLRQVGGPFYEVTATMPVDTTRAQFQAMLQNLMAERFHLVVHHESRTFPGYELVVDKGGAKLKEDMNPPDDAPPIGQRMIVMHAGVGNIDIKYATMSDFAGRLGMTLTGFERVATQKMDSPTAHVSDKTGLAGHYSFKLEYSQPTPPGFTPAPDSPAADLPDLFTVVRSQLGLRLNKTADVPVDVIVVDSVDKIPTEN